VSRFQAERIKSSQEAVSRKLHKVDGARIDNSFVESDALYDWLYEVFNRIRTTESDAKLEALRNVFVNGLTLEKSTGVLKDIVVRRVAEISQAHLETIKLVHQLARPPDAADEEAGGRRDPFARDNEMRSVMTELTDIEFEAVLKDVQGMGIALTWYERGTRAYLSGGPGPERLVLSPLGDAIVDYIFDPR
jgi:hypothetical protein